MRRNEAQTLLDEMVDIHRQIAAKEMEIAQLQDRLNGIREGILSAFMEDAVPNQSPVGEPPVTDQACIMKILEKRKGWVMKAKNSKPVRLQNLITKEERVFESKTAACKFLGITPMTLDKAIKEKGMYKEWEITVAGSPTA